MAKRLSKVDLFYIEHNPEKLAIVLAREIGCSTSQVVNARKKLDKTKSEPKPNDQKPTENTPTIPGAVPVVNTEKGVTVMTPAAAEWADEMSKKTPSGQDYLERNTDRIFRR